MRGYVKDCASAIQIIRQAMDEQEPGWLETEFFCRCCGDYHYLVAETKQLEMVASAAPAAARPANTRRLPPIKPGAPEGWCRWHETASPQLSAPCAFCHTTLHVHQDALGPVKSGRSEKGYLEQRCPACHRPNAVHPVYGKNGVRTSKLDGDAPVLQLTMGTIGR